nr:hypothetical protein BaRGS_003791 [Batillaria attramentaria]
MVICKGTQDIRVMVIRRDIQVMVTHTIKDFQVKGTIRDIQVKGITKDTQVMVPISQGSLAMQVMAIMQAAHQPSGTAGMQKTFPCLQLQKS